MIQASLSSYWLCPFFKPCYMKVSHDLQYKHKLVVLSLYCTAIASKYSHKQKQCPKALAQYSQVHGIACYVLSHDVTTMKVILQ